MSSPEKVTLKCRHDSTGDLWRLRIIRPLTYDKVKLRVKDATGLKVATLKYHDEEGDLCILNPHTAEDFDLLHANVATVKLMVFTDSQEPTTHSTAGMQPLVGCCTNKVLHDSHISASSCWKNTATHGHKQMWRSRLDNVATPWCAGANTKEEYLQWSFDTPRWIGAVQTKGRTDTAQWVKSYRISFSEDGEHWAQLPSELEGNVDQDTLHTSYVPTFLARVVRLHPLAWHRHISMRAELLGWSAEPGGVVPEHRARTDPAAAEKPKPCSALQSLTVGDELRVPAMEDSRSLASWTALGTLQCQEHAGLFATCAWKDQGWGNCKGRVRVVLRRAGKDICTEDIFGLCSRGQDPGTFTPVQRTFTLSDKLISLAEAGDTYHFEYWVGGGGGHKLSVKDFHARALYDKPEIKPTVGEDALSLEPVESQWLAC